jgi:hypothetical protein
MHRITSASVLALALACVADPSAAQDARACTNEVQRLSESFSLADTKEQGGRPVAQAPSARQGATFGDEQKKHLDDLIQQARTAGEQGDGALCTQKLTEARATLREAGIGSSQPGSALGQGRGSTGGRTPGAAGGAGSSPGGAPTGADRGTAGGGAGGGMGGGGRSSGGSSR